MHLDFICECSSQKNERDEKPQRRNALQKNRRLQAKGNAEHAKRIKPQSLGNAFSSTANASKRKHGRDTHK